MLRASRSATRIGQDASWFARVAGDPRGLAGTRYLPVSMATSTSAAPGVGRSGIEGGASTLNRLSSFRFTYVAIFVFLILYVGTIRGAEMLLDTHFRAQVARALRVSPEDGPVIPQMQRGVRRLLRSSAWVRLGEVRVNAFVLGADGTTIYAGGPVVPPPVPGPFPGGNPTVPPPVPGPVPGGGGTTP